jgi:pimeloyl-ACP methyl ester carboxylesterase
MKIIVPVLAVLNFINFPCGAQGYKPIIETCDCMIKVDTRLISHCGYLVVPENRQKPAGRKIKVSFVAVRKPEQDPAKNFTLFTTGGPGYSTIANFDSLRYQSDFLQFGGFIVFDQRGTKKSLPSLDCPEVNPSIKRAYKENLSKDSLLLLAAAQCRKRLAAQGIDLSAYNTIESAADINDLKETLKLDSLTLFGISYSGGLMLTVARNHPGCANKLILGSPLPSYVNYEEHALFNINEAFEQVFANCEADSTNNSLYKNIKGRFRQYFTAIAGKKFTLSYIEKGTTDTLKIQYSKNELFDAILNRLNTSQVKTVPFVMNELMKGNHSTYVKEVLDGFFAGNNSLSHGMRYSVYCSEQIAWSDKTAIKKQYEVLPWMAGYSFNNVDHNICDCWKVKPEAAIVKSPVYSTIPALVTAGDADPWCRPYYNRLIKRTMPNSQLLIFHDRGHVPGMGVKGIDFVKMFITDPYKKIVSTSQEVSVE